MKRKLIYITGGGHSGSTLIDLIVSSTEEVVSIGESCFYNNYENPDHEKKITPLISKYCSCGELFSECPFWGKVRRKLPRPVRVLRVPSLIDSAKIMWNMSGPFSNRYFFKLDTEDDRLFFETVNKVLDEESSEHVYILDSSKDPRRLVRLFQLIGNNQLKVIHLIRDGRGYVNSYYNKQKARMIYEGQKSQNVYLNAFKWIIFNFMTRTFLRKNNIDGIHISYDLFCRNPEKYLSIISERFSLTFPSDYLDVVNSSVHHNIHGNLMRFKKIKSVRYDRSWAKELSRVKMVILTTLLFPFNRIYTNKDDVSE